MKFVFIVLLFFLSVLNTAIAETIRLSEPVHQNDTSESFGALANEWPDFVQLSALLDKPKAYLGMSVSLTVEVSKVCQKKGCFFIAQQGDKQIRVSFKDYGFFVPTDISGRRVSLIGELEKKKVSGAQASHLSKDLGESGSVKRGEQFQIVASTVKIELP